MVKFADVIVITKGDIISQAEREVFMYNVYQANPKAQVIFINGITGQGAFMLKKYINKIEDIDTLEGKNCVLLRQLLYVHIVQMKCVLVKNINWA